MRPGHEDRENRRWRRGSEGASGSRNEARSRGPGEPDKAEYLTERLKAAMRPGHEDRENLEAPLVVAVEDVAAMRPGHEDRENTPGPWLSRRGLVPQ